MKSAILCLDNAHLEKSKRVGGTVISNCLTVVGIDSLASFWYNVKPHYVSTSGGYREIQDHDAYIGTLLIKQH